MAESATLIGGEPDEADLFPYRVLVARPIERTIPIFALVVEARMGPVIQDIIVDRPHLSEFVSGNLARVMEKRYGPHRLVKVRRRHGKRTAVYSHWLAFPDLATAERFAAENPTFGLRAIYKWTETQLLTRSEQLQNGLRKGRYDLGQIGENARLKRATFFVEETATLQQFAGQLDALGMLARSMEDHPRGVSVG